MRARSLPVLDLAILAPHPAAPRRYRPIAIALELLAVAVALGGAWVGSCQTNLDGGAVAG